MLSSRFSMQLWFDGLRNIGVIETPQKLTLCRFLQKPLLTDEQVDAINHMILDDGCLTDKQIAKSSCINHDSIKLLLQRSWR